MMGTCLVKLLKNRSNIQEKLYAKLVNYMDHTRMQVNKT